MFGVAAVPPEECRRRIDAYLACDGNVTRAADQLGLPRRTLGTFITKTRRDHPFLLPVSEHDRAVTGQMAVPQPPPDGFVVRRNSVQYDKDGNPQKQWVQTSQGNLDGWEPPAGHVVKGESAFLDANGHLIGRWVKTKEGASAGLTDALREVFAEFEGVSPMVAAPIEALEDLVTVYPVGDLHLGMYAWGQETGADYDVKIAVQIATDTLGNLIQQSRASSHAVLLILGDFYHQNDQKNATPGSGHQLDVDSRWPHVFLAGAQLVVSLVCMALEKHERVEVKVLPGNHDPDAAVTLAVAVSMYFSNNQRVTVDLTPGVTWYRQFGKVLLGANHGHTMKTAARMAGAMAVDVPEIWGQTLHRFIWTGHLHHEIVKEELGVRVETLSSPAARDAWNSASGYRANRALQGITIHRELGEIGRHRVNIAPAHQSVRAA